MGKYLVTTVFEVSADSASKAKGVVRSAVEFLQQDTDFMNPDMDESIEAVRIDDVRSTGGVNGLSGCGCSRRKR